MENATTSLTDLMRKYYVYYASLFLVIIILATFILNIHIILNILSNKKLHKPINMFIMSLSFNGILVSTTSMPFQFSYVIGNFEWPFSLDMCIFWFIMDFSICTRFVLNFIIIMFIRYMAIEKPNDEWTKKKVQIFTLILVNVLPLLIWSITISSLFPKKELPGECYLTLKYQDLAILDSLVFGLPFVILTIINFKLILKLRKRSKISNTNHNIFQVSNQLISKLLNFKFQNFILLKEYSSPNLSIF